MYSLGKPVITVSDVFDTCVGAVQNSDLADRLRAIRSVIVANELLYGTLAIDAHLEHMERRTELGEVTRTELMALYEDHLSAPRGEARSVYDAIKNAAPNKLCPLCSIGSVAHVDHHLPKSRYPDLSVLLLNLVPACHFCNDTKRARFPRTVGEQTFHPYYDAHLLHDQWIVARLDYGTPLVVTFSVAPPAAWTPADGQRVSRHFKICGLGTSFGTNANANMVSLKRRLQKLHRRGGGTTVQDYLEEERDSHDGNPNSWKHVFYQALAADIWFVSGGFGQIADQHP